MKDMLGNEAINLPEEGEVEVWAVCSEWPNYQVSSFGNVIGRYGRPLKPQMDKNGYLKVWVYGEKGVRKKVFVHRLVAKEFCEGWSPEANICDHDDFCHCNNYYKNLSWQTPKESTAHRRKITRNTNCYTTPILLIDKNNQVVRRFSCPNDAVKEMGVSKHQLLVQLNGNRTPFSYGYYVREADWEAKQNDD